MIRPLIEYINIRLCQTELFETVLGLAEIKTDGKISFPVAYLGAGQWSTTANNLSSYNGLTYIRKNGQITDSQTESDFACEMDHNFTIPLKVICAVPMEKLGDDQFSDDELAKLVMKVLSGRPHDLRRSYNANSVEIAIDGYDTDSLAIIETEFKGLNITDIPFKLSYLAVNLIVTLQIPNKCISDCDVVELINGFDWCSSSTYGRLSAENIQCIQDNLCTGVATMDVDFSASPLSVTIGEPVAFTDLSSPTPTDWCYHFGDGIASFDQDPTHAYAAAGDYTVILLAADLITGSGGGKSRTNYINVSAPTFDPSSLNLNFNFRSDSGVESDAIGTPATNNDTVEYFRDKTANDIDLVQATTLFKPIFKTNQINGHPALEFDGSNDFMQNNLLLSFLNGEDEAGSFGGVFKFNALTGGALFSGLESNAFSTYRPLRDDTLSTDYVFFKRDVALGFETHTYGAADDTDFHSFLVTDTGLLVNIWIDSVHLIVDQSSNLSTLQLELCFLGKGSAFGQHLDGLVAELWGVDRVLTSLEISDSNTYFDNRYFP